MKFIKKIRGFLFMVEHYLDESCLKCAFHNAEEPPLYCDFTGTSIRCTILKEKTRIIKFKEKLL